ncbi:hypothetical protein BSKO_01630 [Bryopsis sp. KO-2023]|nr:hypothetical protein BSKO_01630 [Bryopsis sp. KO-2023]
MENQDPKFARWMRSHGKLTVLKDDEVERLERASKAVSGPSREEVMESMYGRINPKPKDPSYSAEERKSMSISAQKETLESRLLTDQQRKWEQIEVPTDMGVACFNHKWKQNQSYIELFVKLPDRLDTRKVHVELLPKRIKIEWEGFAFMDGELEQEIKQEDSTWFIEGGVLEVHMLKRNRRGNYRDGKTNADTFWRSVLLKSAPEERLKLVHPPSQYYWSHFESDGMSTHNRLIQGKKRRA